MTKKTSFINPTKHYFNVVKQGYNDCNPVKICPNKTLKY